MALSIMFALIAFVTFVTNSALIFAMAYNEMKPRRSPGGPGSVSSSILKNRITPILMTSLAVSDAFVGVIIMPLAVVETINNGAWTLGQHWCTARLVIGVILCAVSIYHVMCMAVDRYLAVCKPLLYRRLGTTVGHAMAALSWVVPTVLILFNQAIGWQSLGAYDALGSAGLRDLCVNLYNQGAFCVNITLYFVLPFAVIFILYFKVLQKILDFNQRKLVRLDRQGTNDENKENRLDARYFKSFKRRSASKTREIIVGKFRNRSFSLKSSRTEENTTSVAVISFKFFDPLQKPHHEITSQPQYPEVGTLKKTRTIASVSQDISGNETAKTRIGNPNAKAFRTIGFVVACFTLCWLPFCLSSAVVVARGMAMPGWLHLGVSWLGYVNSTINPFLFCCNRSVRRSVGRLFLQCVKE